MTCRMPVPIRCLCAPEHKADLIFGCKDGTPRAHPGHCRQGFYPRRPDHACGGILVPSHGNSSSLIARDGDAGDDIRAHRLQRALNVFRHSGNEATCPSQPRPKLSSLPRDRSNESPSLVWCGKCPRSIRQAQLLWGRHRPPQSHLLALLAGGFIGSDITPLSLRGFDGQFASQPFVR